MKRVGLILCQVEGLLSCCRVQARTLHETLLYDSLMRSAVALQSTVPSADSLAARRSILPGTGYLDLMTLCTEWILIIQSLYNGLCSGEILHALEAVAKDALKCVRVKAFLVTSPFIGLSPGQLLYLKRSTCAGLARGIASLECRSGLIFFLSLSLSLFFSLSLSYSLSLSLSLTLTLSLSLGLFVRLSHSRTHTNLTFITYIQLCVHAISPSLTYIFIHLLILMMNAHSFNQFGYSWMRGCRC